MSGLSPVTVLTIALVVGAVLGTFSRLWASPAFSTFGKQFVIEVVSNGIAAVLIPQVGFMVPALDVTQMPPIAAGAAMYFIASGSGDFVGNIRKKFTGGA